MKPTVHDIAERAGVSLATIDRVLNMRPGVHAATRARVEAAIAELGYVRITTDKPCISIFEVRTSISA